MDQRGKDGGLVTFVPAGKVEPGEASAVAATRELHEEIKLDLQPERLIHSWEGEAFDSKGDRWILMDFTAIVSSAEAESSFIPPEEHVKCSGSGNQ